MEQEISLHLGKMTTKEMNQWFGYVSNSQALSGKKAEEKLKELATYCRFEKVYGGFNILEIFPNRYVYVKKKSKAYEIISEHFIECWKEGSPQGFLINQGTNVANIMVKRFKDELTICEKTVYNYISENKIERFGKSKKVQGSWGYCRRIIVKRFINEDGTYRFALFTPEEIEKKKEIRERIFNVQTDDEKDEVISAYNDYNNGLITKEERDDILEIINSCYTVDKINLYFAELRALTGCDVVSVTELIENRKAF